MVPCVNTLLLTLLCVTASVPPQDGGERHKDIKYFAYFGEKVLRRAELIALAKVEKVTPGGPGTEVVKLGIREVVKGDPGRTEELVLASRGDFFPEVEMLIFLEPYGKGNFTTYVGRILKSDPDFAAKRRVLKQYLTLEG